jgi:AraC-like DNA-binding protein
MSKAATTPGHHLDLTRHMQDTNIADVKFPFEIHDLDFLQKENSGMEVDILRSDRFEMLWMREGSGTLLVDKQQYSVKPDVIYCIAPGHPRRFQVENRASGCYICFTPDFIQLSENNRDGFLWFAEYDNFLTVPAIQIDKEIRREMEEIVRQMKKEFSTYLANRPEMLKGLLNIFTLYFSGMAQINFDSCQFREINLSKDFFALLKKHYITKKMVCDYANDLNVSPGYLNRAMKKISGYTASHHIQQHIILEAKRKAIHQGTSMKEIAYQLGFDNPSHFSKFFKRNSGMNFTHYIRKEAFRA